MKKWLIIISLISHLPVSAQDEEVYDTTKVLQSPGTREYFLNESKSLKNTGLLLLIGGTAMFIGGIASGNSGSENSSEPIFGPSFDQGVTLVIFGILASVASIPVFAASARNARKAAAMKDDSGEMNNLPYGKQGISIRKIQKPGRMNQGISDHNIDRGFPYSHTAGSVLSGY